MEILPRMINDAQLNGAIHGFKVARYIPEITHLHFVHGIFIFEKANELKAENLWRFLDQFSRITGQNINFNKSSIHFSKSVAPLQKTLVANILGICQMGWKKYLGKPLLLGKPISQLFDFILERVSSRQNGRKTNFLSQADRTTLIQDQKGTRLINILIG